MSLNGAVRNLSGATLGEKYIITGISADEEMARFLFTLGCFEGQAITVISVISNNYVIVVKDARYSIDKELAMAIEI